MAPLLWKFDTVIFDCGVLGAVSFCMFLAGLYVSSLYFGAANKTSRDNPDVIKSRFARVFAVCVFAVPLFWLCSTSSHSVKARDVFTWLGLRLRGSVAATVLPLLLTMVLFLGPLTLHYLDGVFHLYLDVGYWKSSVRNLIWLRNHIVGPFTEEFVFRACMLPVLVPSLGEHWSLFLCPLFFGFVCMRLCAWDVNAAHVHHMMERIRQGFSVSEALLAAVFQACYTTVFGIYSAFLFLRTGHLIAPVIAHMFCNHMGFPNFSEIFAHKSPTRYYIAVSFAAGLFLWFFLLFPLSEPAIFANDLYFQF